MMKRLVLKIRKLDDGRIYIKYLWHWWEPYHRAYFENEEEAAKFLEKLIKNTKWR